MKEQEPKDNRTATERVRDMLNANRNLVTSEEYEMGILTLQAVDLAEDEIKEETKEENK